MIDVCRSTDGGENLMQDATDFNIAKRLLTTISCLLLFARNMLPILGCLLSTFILDEIATFVALAEFRLYLEGFNGDGLRCDGLEEDVMGIIGLMSLMGPIGFMELIPIAET